MERRATELDGAVRFAGRLDDRELDRTIRGAAVLAAPSTREGWGLAITETAARGVPYVGYDIPAVREQHEVLQGGLLVPPRASALAAAIERVLADPSLARELGERGWKGARSLTWARSAEVAEAAIEQAVERNAAARAGRR